MFCLHCNVSSRDTTTTLLPLVMMVTSIMMTMMMMMTLLKELCHGTVSVVYFLFCLKYGNKDFEKWRRLFFKMQSIFAIHHNR